MSWCGGPRRSRRFTWVSGAGPRFSTWNHSFSSQITRGGQRSARRRPAGGAAEYCGVIASVRGAVWPEANRRLVLSAKRTRWIRRDGGIEVLAIMRQLGVAHEPTSLAGRLSMVASHPVTIGRTLLNRLTSHD